MNDIGTTNLILLAILAVLLVGFGFFVPLLWIAGGVASLFLVVALVRSCFSFLSRNEIQWGLLVLFSGFTVWFSISTEDMSALSALVIPFVIGVVKAINHWDKVSAKKNLYTIKNEGEGLNETSNDA